MVWLIVAALVALVSGLVLFVVGAATMERRGSTWRRVVTTTLLWVWAWGIAAMTLRSRSRGGSDLNLDLLDTTNHLDLEDFWLNILLFAPVGILLAIRGTRFWVALLVGFCGSVAIEITQYAMRIGRTADINDVVSNTIGCVLGFALTAGILAVAKRSSAPRPVVRSTA